MPSICPFTASSPGAAVVMGRSTAEKSRAERSTRKKGKDPPNKTESESLLQKISNKRKKREQIRREAKEQEERYVKFRKEELFAKTRISTRGQLGVCYAKTPSLRMAQFSDSEDKFPAPKMGAGMDFGVYKAALLNKKPNPKYANWTHKAPKEGRYIGLDIGQYLAEFRRTENDTNDRPPIDPEKELIRIKHGCFEDQPINEDGDPVWTSSESEEDTPPPGKDDFLVNYETIEEAVLNPKVLDFPLSKQKYDADDDYEDLKKQRNDRGEVVKNTLRSVVNLATSTQTFLKDKDSSRAPESKVTIKYMDDVILYKYNREDLPCNIQPKREKRLLKHAERKKKEKE